MPQGTRWRWLGLGALVLAGCADRASPRTIPDGGALDLARADLSAVVADLGGVDLADAGSGSGFTDGGCPVGMTRVTTYCMDTYEAYVVEIDAQGNEHPHSPYLVIGDLGVRAKNARGAVPQGYIRQIDADRRVRNAAGKRLCSAAEFVLGCRGPNAANDYPYGGTVDKAGYCNEGKGSSMTRFFGSNANNWTYAEFNDPRLNEWDGGLAPSGAYTKCVSPYGLYDCMGNLHEWGSDAADAKGHGRFRGGFYGDAEINGPGCLYVTSAHELAYHDYSTGFRCCADPVGAER